MVVMVIDVNDNAPVFGVGVYFADILEDAALGTLVVAATATDSDKSVSAVCVCVCVLCVCA